MLLMKIGALFYHNSFLKGQIIMGNEKLLRLIEVCVDLCKREKNSGYCGEVTQEQVEKYILPELDELKREVVCNNLPNDRYLLAFGYAFRVWEWHTESSSELFSALQNLHNAYKESSKVTK